MTREGIEAHKQQATTAKMEKKGSSREDERKGLEELERCPAVQKGLALEIGCVYDVGLGARLAQL